MKLKQVHRGLCDGTTTAPPETTQELETVPSTTSIRATSSVLTTREGSAQTTSSGSGSGGVATTIATITTKMATASIHVIDNSAENTNAGFGHDGSGGGASSSGSHTSAATMILLITVCVLLVCLCLVCAAFMKKRKRVEAGFYGPNEEPSNDNIELQDAGAMDAVKITTIATDMSPISGNVAPSGVVKDNDEDDDDIALPAETSEGPGMKHTTSKKAGANAAEKNVKYEQLR